MARYKCAQCGEEVEARCKPGKCKVCGAAREQLVKVEAAGEKKKSKCKGKVGSCNE